MQADCAAAGLRPALTLVYLVAEKMSSNFFLRVWPSASGQLESSWCTKMTFSRMACNNIKVLFVHPAGSLSCTVAAARPEEVAWQLP